MSFLNENLPNDLSSRFKKIYSDEFWIKSAETGSFIPFIPGSGGSSEVPYWVKPINAVFENGFNKNTIDHSDVKLEKTDLNSYSKMNYTNLQIVENVSSLGGIFSVSPSSFFIGSHTSGSNNIDLNKSYTSINAAQIQIKAIGSNELGKYRPNSITFNKDAVDYVFNLPVLKDVLKLYNKTLLATPTSSEKMVLYNPTTQDYNYSEIPSSGGASYPYLEPTRINLTSVYQGVTDRSIVLDSLNSTITCRYKAISGSEDNYTSISPGVISIKPPFDFPVDFNADSIRTVNKLKPLAISAQSPHTTDYEFRSEYLKFNPSQKTFHREFAYKMILNADTDLISLKDNGLKPRLEPTEIFNSKYFTASIPETYKNAERITLVINNLIYNRWYMINLRDDSQDVITIEKTTLSTTLPRSYDGELVYMKSTQSQVTGLSNANATNRTFFKILCPDVPDTSTKCQFTFVVKRWTKSISNHITLTPEYL